MSKSARSVIRLRGVRHNNLKNFDLDLPLNQLIVITGLSGSGKSSLAFDTLFAEGQRRYIETFSPYARQFFDRMDKPRVDSIEGIPPAIAIQQRNAVKSTRSTVGTMTEICDHMKVLWPHIARLHCRQCGKPVRKDSPQQIWESLSSAGRAPVPTWRRSPPAAPVRQQRGSSGASPHQELLITFDLPLSEKLSLEESLDLIAKQGYQRLLIGDQIRRLDDLPSNIQDPESSTPHPVPINRDLADSASSIQHRACSIRHLTVIQDRLKLAPANRARFVEACEQAYHFGKGRLAILMVNLPRRPDSDATVQRFNGVTLKFSNRLHCAACDIEYRDPTPAFFSFNHPVGACPACKGFGRIISIDYALAIPDRSLTLAQGAVKPWRTGFSADCQADLMKFCKVRRVPVHIPFDKLSEEHQGWVAEGDRDYGTDEEHEWPRAWYGVKGYFRWLESKAYKMHVRVLLSRYRAYTTCTACHGARFQAETLLYRFTNNDLRLTHPLRRARSGPDIASIVNRQPQMTLADFYALPIRDALAVIEAIALSRIPHPASRVTNDPVSLVLSEIRSRLGYLDDVGLGYLTLDRPTRSLSGGETERVNLTTCLGSRLVNTLYVLDEPSVGLHPRDTDRLVRILQKMRDAGNTVVVVEHEASVMRAADRIVDLGPGHGATGGQVVFQGNYSEILKSDESLTGQYLSGKRQIDVPRRRPVKDAGATLQLTHATRHNLRDVAVEIPLARFVCVTGVSGSGKTTLIREVLLPALDRHLKSQSASFKAAASKASDRIDVPPSQNFEGASGEEKDGDDLETRNPETKTTLSGHEQLGRVVLVDQSILGKTPRSNPAVYIGAFDDIREFFAQSEPAQQRGLNASAFSFNSSQGQCERCRGAGFEKIEMQFLSDVFIRCPDCDGRRYRQHILQVRVEGRGTKGETQSRPGQPSTPDPRPSTVSWSIADLLEATVDEAIDFLGAFPNSRPAERAIEGLKLLQEVGLGYLRLGQPINTLSGGESQRLKLVRHLAEAAVGRRGSMVESQTAPRPRPPTLAPQSTLFLFDEPTTGLHFDDVRVLLKVFQRLVDAGHSVIVIEHNLDVIKSADWIIDLGPEAGADGGRIVAQGAPEEVAACADSHTGRFLGELLSQRPGVGSRGRESQESQPASTAISIHGAREHNLKNLSLSLPRGQFVVITGVSGSGKSTLAFDLLFAEGQRRFLDSMNVYARQFVEQLSRPDVDLITGIPPTVSIEQRNSRGGGKSTVATVTEIHHFVRLLFARLGTQFCPECRVPVEAQTRDEVGRRLGRELTARGALRLLAPMVKSRKGFHTDVARWAARHGYAEIRADGRIHAANQPFRLDRFREHNVELVVGVLKAKRGAAVLSRSRSGDGMRLKTGARAAVADGAAGQQTRAPWQIIDETLKLGHGTLLALDHHGQLTVHSTERSCPDCGRSFEPLDPKNFSYNSPQGWCARCRGFGELFYMPEDVDRGAREDAIAESWYGWQEGEREPCPECRGTRLNPVARAVRLIANVKNGRTMDDLGRMSVDEAGKYFSSIEFKGPAADIARDILPEIRERLNFLHEVGLGYLQLGRGVPTLSGGESQRIRLAAQLGSNLTGVLYILDEPTIGLHARDNERLLATLERLRSRGNSVVVVEHDEETMRRADYIVDLGPGPGVHGGEVVAAGTLPELLRHPDSITGQCLRARNRYPTRGQRRLVKDPKDGIRSSKSKDEGHGSTLPASDSGCRISDLQWLTLNNAARNNLENLTVRFPLRRLVCVTGVSGSGKSTLVRECLLPPLAEALKVGRASPRAAHPRSDGSSGASPRLTGWESLKAVYEVDQAPIGRTPRSIPATYVGFFDEIRRLFAQVPEARLRGYSPARFSFNSPQGRCPECEGAGQVKLEMSFLPPAFVRCEVCGGTRFNRETLDIEFRGKNIAQVLELSVEEAMDCFVHLPRIKRALQALSDTGLGYLKLGQTSPTLSGGEAQRVKLVTHLLAGLGEARGGRDEAQAGDLRKPPASAPGSRIVGGPASNLFILEEPTIGLHMADVRRLVEVLQRLVDRGHSVLVIEHNLELIAEADWIIDLGPEGGNAGGRIVAEGTPEQLVRNRHSHTGRFLRNVLHGP